MGWVLVQNGTRRQHWLRPGSLKVGRAEAAQVRQTHQSVSRIHAEIVVERLVGSLAEVAPTNISLIDRSSTGHTAINGQMTPGRDVPSQLKDGDLLAFGVDPGSLTVQWSPVVLSFSSRRKPEEAERMEEQGRTAGVFLTPEWTSSCTHLLCEQLAITPKLLCCIADGGVPVSPSFLDALASCDHGATPPELSNHRPKPPDAASPDATHTGLLSAYLESPRSRQSLLRGVWVIFSQKISYNALSKPLVHAGSQVQLICTSKQQAVKIEQDLRSGSQTHGVPQEVWVVPPVVSTDAHAPDLAAAIREISAPCLGVPLEVVVQAILAGSLDGVRAASQVVPMDSAKAVSVDGLRAVSQVVSQLGLAEPSVKTGSVKAVSVDGRRAVSQVVSQLGLAEPSLKIGSVPPQAKKDDPAAQARTSRALPWGARLVKEEESFPQTQLQGGQQQQQPQPSGNVLFTSRAAPVPVPSISMPPPSQQQPAHLASAPVLHSMHPLGPEPDARSLVKRAEPPAPEDPAGRPPAKKLCAPQLQFDHMVKKQQCSQEDRGPKPEGPFDVPLSVASDTGARLARGVSVPSSINESGIKADTRAKFDADAVQNSAVDSLAFIETPRSQWMPKPPPKSEREIILDSSQLGQSQVKDEERKMAVQPRPAPPDIPAPRPVATEPIPVEKVVHPTGAWLPSKGSGPPRLEHEKVMVDGVSMPRASWQVGADPVVCQVPPTAPTRQGGRTRRNGGARNFKLFRKAAGQNEPPTRVPVAPYVPPAAPPLAELFSSQHIDSQVADDDLPPAHRGFSF